MGKTKKIFVALLLATLTLFSFAGCASGVSEEATEPDGKLYTIINAVESGWIDEYDLKSIACGYYEWRNIEDNPYSGLYEEPAERLSGETENKIKGAYFDQSEEVKILKYYGTYDGNIVVTLGYENANFDGGENTDVTFGGVVFPDMDLYPIRVYHYPEKVDPSIKVTGRIRNLKTAYEKGWLSENDLKSIACYVNERDVSVENPYSGMYEAPTEKLSNEMKTELKTAYLRQVDEVDYEELDGIIIHRYIGIYQGNTVISISGVSCKFPSGGTEIGGVTFNNYSWRSVYVYKK